MTMLRDHAIFTITVEYDARERIEDDLGELTGYGQPYRTTIGYRVVAPSREIAKAWALARRIRDNPIVLNAVEQQLDGFIQDHIW